MKTDYKKIAPQKLTFCSDYMAGAHPKVMEALNETNLMNTAGYGTDPISEHARNRIREACKAPEAEIFFLAGGTQTNATVITALLQPYQGVLSSADGHISVHEAGAVEHNGHKVLVLPFEEGKISAGSIRRYCEHYREDESWDHIVMPGMVYVTHPTEYGTLYSRREMEEIRKACDEFGLKLYLDGARLAYALASPQNDLTLADIARLCDAFYIGGTKCGALFGEAVVFPKPGTVPHFFMITKLMGALLAKGRIAGIQFDALFTDGLYEEIGRSAVEAAGRIQDAMEEKGYELLFRSPTNQIFLIMDDDEMNDLLGKVDFEYWDKYTDDSTVVRFVTSWSTTEEDVEKLISLL
jgi:threonine aldolase